MPVILFVCTANRYRSPIAEACFKDELQKHNQGEGWIVQSAGTWTKDGLPAMPEAIDGARKLGLDISGHFSQVITEKLMKQADLILVMERGQKEALQIEFPTKRGRVFLLSEAANGIAYDVPDPVSNPDAGNVVLEIKELIKKNFEKIIALANE